MSKQADYGILIMSHLAHQAPTSTHSAKDIAQSLKLTIPMVAKILKVLSRAGLVSSVQGTKGGYHLVRSARDIPILQVLEALSGPLSVTSCQIPKQADKCQLESMCRLKPRWQSINETLRQALTNLALSDMASHNDVPQQGRRHE